MLIITVMIFSSHDFFLNPQKLDQNRFTLCMFYNFSLLSMNIPVRRKHLSGLLEIIKIISPVNENHACVDMQYRRQHHPEK